LSVLRPDSVKVNALRLTADVANDDRHISNMPLTTDTANTHC